MKKNDPIEIYTSLNSINTSRFLYYQNLFKQTESIDGDIVECGVGMGKSFLSLALLIKCNSDNRNIWGFDSFEGFPEPSKVDKEAERNPKKGQYSVSLASINKMLRENIDDEHFLRTRTTLVKGYFEKTLKTLPVSKISLLNLDVDIYESYLTCLTELYPKLSIGGIVTFDEYVREGNNFPGGVKAINEYFEGKEVIFERDRFYGKYYVRKISD